MEVFEDVVFKGVWSSGGEKRNMLKEKDKEGFLADKIVPEMRSILGSEDSIGIAAEKIDVLLSGVAKDTCLGVEDIPVLYALAQKKLDGEEAGVLSRVTFKIFTGMTIDEYAEKFSKNTSLHDVRTKEGARIVTLTPNLALDFAADCVIHFLGTQGSRGKAFKLDAGGKGLNVSVGLHKWGIKTIPMGFIGGPTGKIMIRLLNNMGISTGHLTGIEQNTRINPSVHAAQKGQVHLENIGPTISPEEQEGLEKTLLNILREGDHLLMAGSLPKGVGDNYYGEWIEKAKKKGVKTYVDTRNVRALEYAIKAGPHFLGINIKELANYLGVSVEELEQSDEKITACSRSLVRQGIEKVVISMGHRGIIMSSKDGNWLARPPEIEKISPVGAGDTIKMAFVYADKNGMADLDALKLATAASAVSVTKIGTELAGLDESLEKMQYVRIKSVSANETKRASFLDKRLS
ncbi:MAG: hexose kinase [Candidatus Omnitrophota bacterium]